MTMDMMVLGITVMALEQRYELGDTNRLMEHDMALLTSM